MGIGIGMNFGSYENDISGEVARAGVLGLADLLGLGIEV